MAKNTNLKSKIGTGMYFGGNINGFNVDSQPTYIDDVMHIQTKVRDAAGDLVLIETNKTLKAHKEMAVAMLADMEGYVA